MLPRATDSNPRWTRSSPRCGGSGDREGDAGSRVQRPGPLPGDGQGRERGAAGGVDRGAQPSDDRPPDGGAAHAGDRRAVPPDGAPRLPCRPLLRSRRCGRSGEDERCGRPPPARSRAAGPPGPHRGPRRHRAPAHPPDGQPGPSGDLPCLGSEAGLPPDRDVASGAGASTRPARGAGPPLQARGAGAAGPLRGDHHRGAAEVGANGGGPVQGMGA